MFEKYGKPTWYIDRLIYTYPLIMAAKFNTPLLVYGENVSYEYGGSDSKETYSAKEQLSNGVASGVDEQELISGFILIIEHPNSSEMFLRLCFPASVIGKLSSTEKRIGFICITFFIK